MSSLQRVSTSSLARGEYTQEELDRIQITLSKVLGPEYISSRPGGGGSRVSYLEGWKALNLANEVFGFNGWSSEIISTTVDYCDTNEQGRVSIGISIIVRVTIKDGTFREDIGYGFIDNAKGKAAAFEKCKKEAFTDGIKRCLRCFGNVLGNCLYDKNLLAKLRHANKENSALTDADIYKNDELSKIARQRQEKVQVSSVSTEQFEENLKSYQKSAPQSPQQEHKQLQPSGAQKTDPPKTTTAPLISTRTKPSDDDFDDSFLFSDDIDVNKMDDYEMEMIMNKGTPEAAQSNQTNQTNANQSNQSHNTNPPQTNTAPVNQTNTAPQPDANPTVGFISARGADLLKTPGSDVPEFDPKFISPNMRRTLDPTKSVPVKRTDLTSVPSTSIPIPEPSDTPSKGKRIGAPSTYRAPLKRIKENLP
ncbi:DNA repair and recombination protein Rad52p [[Candida] jaroonii]|uniref:DNA repair and recombination protein Rad52p n=1 Tax=[Candida] jaroonii TaxID=467808 RepID=A0ACA9Y452_9ASCO|nr:DNA repair and recombination protein Rad52p [[Candida] jaroonii]